MTEKQNDDYDNGVRDGRLTSLEATARETTEDLKKIKVMIYMLYGAIALVQFLPELRGFISGAS